MSSKKDDSKQTSEKDVEDVVQILRLMAAENDWLVKKIKEGKLGIETVGNGTLENLLKTYEFWGNCLMTTAWLLENTRLKYQEQEVCVKNDTIPCNDASAKSD